MDFVEIKEELVKIECSKDAYITRSGKVFLDYGNDAMFPLKTFVNKHNGYLYVGFDGADGKRVQRRVHVLVAKAFIPNPYNFPQVGHKDDLKDKSNNCVDNLYWATNLENARTEGRRKRLSDSHKGEKNYWYGRKPSFGK